MIRPYVKLIRVHHYIKNLLVFAALLCSGQLFIREKFLNVLGGFISFCLIASAIYIINDIRDRESDQRHPIKCNRPIASGEISVRNAFVLCIILFIIVIITNIAIGGYSAGWLVLYFIMNLGYSFGMKNIPLADVFILATGFLIRIVYGAAIANIAVSNWLYLTVVTAALYFAFGKRRNELKDTTMNKTRKVLDSYSENFLDKSMYMCLSLTIVFYALWSMDEKTLVLYGNKYLIFTVPVVIFITMKYSMDIEKEASDGDPVEVLLHDKVLFFSCMLYLISMFLILYIM